MDSSARARSAPVVVRHEHLDKGKQANVYRGTFGGRDVALKVFVPKKGENGGGGLKFPDYWHELKVLSRLSIAKHPAIVKLETHCCPTLVLELLTESLGCNLRKHHPVPLSRRLIQLCDIAEGVCFVNREGFLHLDIKPGNIMLTSAGRCKLIDFALAEEISDPIDWTYVPPCYYTAPELSGVWTRREDDRLVRVRKGAEYHSVAADSYGLGLVAISMVQEFSPVLYTWDLDGDRVLDFQALEQGGMCHLDDNHEEELPAISYQGRADGPFANADIRTTIAERLAYPALSVIPEQRIIPEQFLIVAKECHARFCQHREPEQSPPH